MTGLRVGFNAYLLSRPDLRGWTRYTINLLSALPAHGVKPVLYSTEPIHSNHLARLAVGTYELRVGPRTRYLIWENWWLPRQLRDDAIDVFHCPMNYGMPWSTPCPRVLTLHDAIDQVYYLRRLPRLRRWRWSTIRLRLTNWAARSRAHRIITVSEHAKSDLIHFLNLQSSRVSVIYEAADPAFHRSTEPAENPTFKAKFGIRRPYFLYVGGWEGRKNLPFLLRGFASAKLEGIDLVLAGGGEVNRAGIHALRAELGCVDSVHFIGFVPEAELPALYAGALAFVYPSEYEGFGLQVCEAMAVGCPVLVARATSLPEIAGTGGETFSLDSPEELTSLIRRVASDDAFRAALSDRARTRSQCFSWDRAAGETAQVYRELASGAA